MVFEGGSRISHLSDWALFCLTSRLLTKFVLRVIVLTRHVRRRFSQRYKSLIRYDEPRVDREGMERRDRRYVKCS